MAGKVALISFQPDPQFKRKIEMTLSLFVNIVLNHYSEAFKTATERVAPVGKLASQIHIAETKNACFQNFGSSFS